MESAAIHSAKHILFIVGVILLSGSLSGILAQKLKVPDVVVFLLIGMGLGPEACRGFRCQGRFHHQSADPDLRLFLHPLRRRRQPAAQGAEGGLDNHRW